ncbi:MAG: hypothetical protein CMI31_09175 [Opitutae bacterium]|nr:hypothetical protein [Opitutae bacterium]|tara:strand:- start:142 stop:1683 length:1542 start_codon:yes stop_codon:yes gene_type:complete
MSGPKVCEIDYEAILRAQMRNREEWTSLLARYKSELRELTALTKQASDLGLQVSIPASTKALRSQTQHLLEEGEGDGAVSKVRGALNKAQSDLAGAKSNFKAKVTELQRRHGQLKSGLKQLSVDMDGFPKQYADLVPRNFPKETVQELRQNLQAKLDGFVVPASPELQLSGAGIAALDQAEAKLQTLQGQLDSIREEAFQTLNDENSRLVTESILKGAEPVQSLSEWLADNQPEPDVTDEKSEKVAEKVNKLLAELVVLKDYPDWQRLYGKAEKVLEEASSSRKRMLYENLVLECSAKVKRAKKHEAWSKGLRVLQAAADMLKSASGKDFAEELEAFERSGETSVSLEELKARLKTIESEEKRARETQERIDAVLESLQEQGYELGEELMEVVTVEKGKLVFAKPLTLSLPGEEDYGIRVSVSGEKGVQTEMVRYEDVEESANQKIRDQEKEESWCAHHAQMRKDLEGRGYSIKLKLKKNAGELPMRVVSRGKAKATRRRGASLSSKLKRKER